MHNRWKIVILLLMIVSLMSGCSGKKEVLEPLQPSKIKVIYQDEEAFYHDYGKYFHMKYPQIEVEVIPESQVLLNLGKTIRAEDWDAEIKKLLENSGADVIKLGDAKTFQSFAEAGRLYELEEMIRQDDYDMKGFLPGLIDRIKSLGNGKLYGLAPYVDREVLYYNAALFKELQIEPPKNNMTWQEMFDLSARFSNIGSGDNKVYGFYEWYGNIGAILYKIADSSGLKLLDPKGEKVLLNSDGWKKAIKQVTDAVRSKSVFLHPEGQIYSQKLRDQTAMTIGSAHKTRELIFTKQDWGVVTAPVDPAMDSSSISFAPIYAIAADSANKRAAWEFVKFVNGPEMAQARSRTLEGKLPSRNGYMKDIKGRSTDAFYMPKIRQESSLFESLPFEFFRLFYKPLREELLAVVANEKSVDDAAAALEAKAQELLLKVRESANKDEGK
ncbi:ABC transporter substrate-binding protein [Paenibacillus alvei]|uniref:ABC transporter substrate-binding protein n=1 Tax=Paenibacillus alvei TaxID=44250 RepID=UPI0018CCE8A9|nr:extracellular solute-binding protein [Paenibacillus alvei]MBG9733560.1 sugar ABC transporter substrate-binding protein [Paenibacillus alvei]MBG9744865.1 sugar ABC transporter substrate-binding protein [Paenibacillus alvei]MCY9578679.1 extracellular solute-binding protein [Paenibacillus alvei]MCY9583738.1 extracellular solute-binding protein [Paenibacillus alvei]